LGGGWLWRTQVAEWAVRRHFSGLGVDSALDVRALSLSGVRVEALRLGPSAAPDLRVEQLEIGVQWDGWTPSIDHIKVIKLQLNGILQPDGVRFGQLDALMPAAGDEPASLRGAPPWRVTVDGAVVGIASPWGVAQASLSGDGRLGEDWTGAGEAALAGETGGGVVGPLSLAFDRDGWRVQVQMAGERLGLGEAVTLAPWLEAQAQGAPGLDAAQVRLEAGAQLIQRLEARVGGPTLSAQGRLAQGGWTGAAELQAQALEAGAIRAGGFRSQASLAGAGGAGRGALEGELQAVRAGDIRIATLRVAGPVELSPSGLRVGARLSGAGIQATPDARERWLQPLQALSESPLGELATGAAATVRRALTGLDAQAEADIDISGGDFGVALSQPLAMTDGRGLSARFTPSGRGLRWTPAEGLRGAGRLELDGPALPSLRAELRSLGWGVDGAGSATGAAEARWQAGDSRLIVTPTEFQAQQDALGGGGLRLMGGVLELSGRGGAGAVEALRLPLGLRLAWGDRGLVEIDDGCLPIAWRSAAFGALRLEGLDTRLCQRGGPLLAWGASEAPAGGFDLQAFTLSGRLEKEPVALRFEGLAGAWRAGAPLRLQSPGLRVSVADAVLAIGEADASVRLAPTLEASGRLSGVAAEAPQAPTRLTDGAFAWRWSAAGGLMVQYGGAQVLAVEPAPGELRLHEPLRVGDVRLQVRQGRAEGQAALYLQDPAARLGAFRLQHDFARQSGVASFDTGKLRFTSDFQPYQVTALLQGLVSLVRGEASAEGELAWDGAALRSGGVVHLRNLSFATLTLGPVTGVDGDIVSDDLLALTTPPGQTLRVREVNPGLPIEDGVVRFQLQPGLVLRLDGAEWPYAGGRLSIDPTQLTLGSEESAFLVRLEAVDLGALLQRLGLDESISATGTVSGAFPMRFTPSGGEIEGGQLRALGPGLIAMQSPSLDQTVAAAGAQAGASGASFLQALQGFRYDELLLADLSGPLDGTLDADIRLSGENVAPITLPTLGGKNVVGLPYRFRITVSAPLSQLARTVQGSLDVREGLRSALEAQAKKEAEAEKDSAPP